MNLKKVLNLKPKALYHALKVETELNPDIEKDELKKKRLWFLGKNNKEQNIWKKIIRELKKRSIKWQNVGDLAVKSGKAVIKFMLELITDYLKSEEFKKQMKIMVETLVTKIVEKL